MAIQKEPTHSNGCLEIHGLRIPLEGSNAGQWPFMVLLFSRFMHALTFLTEGKGAAHLKSWRASCHKQVGGAGGVEMVG